jgi:anaerobic selenocysteine-containing dehydrogenase
VARGALCAKVKDYETRVIALDWLLYLLKRLRPKGSGQFQRISWDEAPEEIANQFHKIIAEHGQGPAALPLFGLHGYCATLCTLPDVPSAGC